MLFGMAAVAMACAVGMAPPPLVEAAVPLPATSRALPRLGVMVDVGLPDGAGASLLYRPLPGLRLAVGGMTNAVSAGLRAGLTLEPLRTFVRPSLTLEGGHYFEGNANAVARRVSGDPSFDSQLLERFSYDFANAHLGLEIGAARRLSFFLHAGVSRVWLDVANVSETLQRATQTGWSAQPVHVQLNSVSAKLGFILFFS